MSEFERKLIQGIHDDRWTGKITGFRSGSGVREYPIEPDDQDVNPDRNAPVVVLTTDTLAAELRKAKAEAWEEGVATALNHAKRGSDGITLKLVTFDGDPWQNPYRADELEGEG